MTEEVLQKLRATAADRPDDPVAQHELALALAGLGRTEEAAGVFEVACQLQPTEAAWHFNRALAWQNTGQLPNAIAAYHDVLKRAPDFGPAWINLAHAYKTNGNLSRSEEAGVRAVELQPEEADAHKALGSALRGAGKLEEAAAAFEAARKLDTDDWPNQLNLANTLKDAGQIKAGIDLLRAVVAARPDWPEAHRDLAQALLLDGQFAEGWRENVWRWETAGMERRKFDAPEWNGEPLAGRTILLHTEQGFGDAIQFVRYATVVAGQDGRVLVECPPELERLFGTVADVEQVLVRGAPLPDFDFHCPLLELPRILETTEQSIPATVPYLHAQDIGAKGARLRVGLSWAGSDRALNNRSMPPEALAVLLEAEAVEWNSLQLHGGPDLERLGWSERVADRTQELRDFADTAAHVCGLDLIITVDTSVAHLVGALGQPTWLLLARGADWRWLADREDSPWYPNMRLFRMGRGEDWPAVIRRVRKALDLKLAMGRLDGE